jgi:hypothetical protein
MDFVVNFHGALEEEIDNVLSSHEHITNKRIVGNVFGMFGNTCNKSLFMIGSLELMNSTFVKKSHIHAKCFKNCFVTRLILNPVHKVDMYC